MPRKKDKTTREKIEETQLQLEKLKQDLAALKEQEKEEKRKAIEEEITTLGKAVRTYITKELGRAVKTGEDQLIVEFLKENKYE